jgi:hypothetical protein
MRPDGRVDKTGARDGCIDLPQMRYRSAVELVPHAAYYARLAGGSHCMCRPCLWVCALLTVQAKKGKLMIIID